MLGDTSSFAFTISLAAVINGLGIVRLLSTFTEYIDLRGKVRVTHYWVYALFLVLQFLFHVLLWWTMWDMRSLETFNFLSYLYLLMGPILLYVATSLLLPNFDEEQVLDLRDRYYHLAPSYFTVMSLLWLWSISFWPVLVGVWSPDTPLIVAALVVSLILRFSSHARVHEVLVLAYCVLLVLSIAFFSLELGGIGNLIRENLDR